MQESKKENKKDSKKDSKKDNKVEPINIIDLFAGVGGLSFGFSKNKAFDILMANELDVDIATAYSMNHPTVDMVNCSITDLDEATILKHTQGKKVDLIVGGPPCQSYSTLGKREMDDRANLFMQYKRILSIVRPKAFMFENVRGILSMDGGKLFPKVQKEFEELGYELKYKVLNAVDYGVPQYRERVILVGFKGKNPFEFPKETNHPRVTLKEALGDLPALKCGETGYHYVKEPDNPFLKFVRDGIHSGAVITEHRGPKSREKLRKIMEALEEGQSKDDLPEDIRPKTGYCNTYAKLWWNRPAITITRNFACPSSTRCIHPRDSRALSTREGARLQSFPDDYQFFGNDAKKRLEIGNAVPPLLSVLLAKQMEEAFGVAHSES